MRHIAWLLLLVSLALLLWNCAELKAMRVQSLSPVWYGKENVRLFPVFFHARGWDGKITSVPYLIKSVDEGTEFMLLHPLNYVVDVPLLLLSMLVAWEVEGPDIPFMEHWFSMDCGWFFFILNQDTVAFRLTPLLFLHWGNMFNSKLHENLAFTFIPQEEKPEGACCANIYSTFPLFHLSRWTEDEKPDRYYSNLSLLWFLYWHWKVPLERPTWDELCTTSHYFIFLETQTRRPLTLQAEQ